MKQDANAILIDVPAAPPTANLIWRSAHGQTYLSQEAKTFIQLVALSVRGCKLPANWDAVKVEITVAPTRRSGDVDNRVKPVLDALTRCGFWRDDAIVARSEIEFAPPEKNGRTVIKVTKHARGKFAAPFPEIQNSLF